MANNPLDKERSIAEKVAQLEAEKAREAEDLRKKEAERLARLRAKEAREQRRKEEAQSYEQKIRSMINSQTESYYWYSAAERLLSEIQNSDVDDLINSVILNDLKRRSAEVWSRYQRKKKRKETIKKVLLVMPVILVCLLAVAFSVYSWFFSDSILLFRIAFGADIAVALGICVITKIHFVKDHSTVMKILCIFLALVISAVAVAMGVSGRLVEHEYVTDDDGFIYEIKNEEYYLHGCENSITELVISQLSHNIVGVSANAFKGNTTLTKLTVDVYGLKIEKEAFANCSALSDVEFGVGEVTLNGKIFKDCKALVNVSFNGGNYTFGGNDIFTGCTALKNIYFTSGSYIGSSHVSILGGLGKVAVHHDKANIGLPLSGADELTLVVYPGTNDIFGVKPDVLVFADGFDFSGDFHADKGSFDLSPFAPTIYLPSSVTYVPDILGSDRRNYNVYYQGTQDMWNNLSIAGDKGFFDLANMNYKESHITLHYNSNCRFWVADNVQTGD